MKVQAIPVSLSVSLWLYRDAECTMSRTRHWYLAIVFQTDSKRAGLHHRTAAFLVGIERSHREPSGIAQGASSFSPSPI
jgi:hypothetical protein